MPERIVIKTIGLQGFRAFLRSQTFEFGAAGKSLAVFAPNARGKSSLVDGPEYFLSAEGTLARLGKIRTGNQAGRDALQHVEAAAKNITGQVTLRFHDGTAEFGDTRAVVSQTYARPAAAGRVVAAMRVPFLIRGYELRRFVEDQTAEERYEEIAGWFSLSRLVNLQSAIKDTRSALKRKVNDNTVVTERTKDLARVTDRALTAWNEAQALAWLNDNCLKPLDAALGLAALSIEDPAVAVIRARKEEEERRIGIDTLKDAIAQIKSVHLNVPNAPPSGAISSFEKAYRDLGSAREHEASEKTKAEKAVFKDVWEAAEKVLGDKSTAVSACPVCATDLANTAAGSRDALAAQLGAHLSHLKTYRDAFQALDKAKKAASAEWNGNKAALAKLQALLKAAGYAAEAEAVTAYAKEVAELSKDKALPDAAPLKTKLEAALTAVQAKHDAILSAQGKSTYGKVLSKLEDLLLVKRAMDGAAAKKAQLEALSSSLYTAGASIDASIRAYVETIISALRVDTNTLYRAIQGGAADCPTVRLELPGPDEVNQRRLSLVIDFGGKTGVPPSGYLSDSQVHTLALSLRLAAIKRLNKSVATIVFDDIVTSYDADHRRDIAAMICSQLSDFQIIVVTHDERFFSYLREMLPQNSWLFNRITALEPDHGPRVAEHKTRDEDIESIWGQGRQAANEIRQAEEEWLRRVCVEFGVDARMKEFGVGHERSECAQALASFLKSKKIAVPQVNGVANPFLSSLARGVVENFGSHFQDGAYSLASAGDERRRWNEFKEFRDMFKCPASGCGKTKFTRPGTLDKPMCQACQTPFAFGAAPAAAAPAAGTPPPPPASAGGSGLAVAITGGQPAEAPTAKEQAPQ